MNNQQFCSSCGTKLEPSSQFCPQCGAKVLTSKPESGATKKCSQCQSDMPANAVKCPKCGSWLTEISNWMNIGRAAYISCFAVLIIWFIWVRSNYFYHWTEIYTRAPGSLMWIMMIICMVVYIVYWYKVGKRTGRWWWW